MINKLSSRVRISAIEPKTWVVIWFFGMLIVLGALIYKDYGFPWDEVYRLELSHLTINYIGYHDKTLLTHNDRYYGAFFEIILYGLSKNASLSKEIYIRHFCVFITFLTSSFLFFDMVRKTLKDFRFAMLATVLLIVSPRIFADSFYNSKDIPFLAFAIFWSWTLINYISILILRKNTRHRLIYGLFQALATAGAITIRIAGVIFFLITFMLFIWIICQNRQDRLFYIKNFLYYSILVILITYLVWPILWNNPIGEFINAFSLMKQYPYQKDVFYLGKFYSPCELPWHYLPVWIAISSPLLVVFGVLVGHVSLGHKVFRRLNIQKRIKGGWFVRGFFQHHWLVFFCWLYLPVVAIYFFHSTLYDGWRHMYFIYPPIVIISVFGLKQIWEWSTSVKRKTIFIKWVVGSFIILSILDPLLFMIRNHPHENVYFNFLVGDRSQVRSKFDLDYWGLSYKQAVDYILEKDDRNWFTVYAPTPAGLYYIQYMLPEDQLARIGIVSSPYWADYFMSDYRWHPQDYPYPNKFYSIKVEGAEIMVVYKLRE